jgi:alcohol dehydrogenase class IV
LSAGEFSAYSGVTDERHRIKELFRHPLIIPRAVVLDPAVTVHTPEWLFLSTGIRAVDHCVEGICSSKANPYGDAQALHGLPLLAYGLPRVKADPGGRPRRSRGPATRRTRIRSAASMSTCTAALTRSAPIGCSGAPTLRGCPVPGGNA